MRTIDEALESIPERLFEIGITDLTWAEILTILKAHDADVEEFLKDLRPNGPNSLNEYTGEEVLGWLGY